MGEKDKAAIQYISNRDGTPANFSLVEASMSCSLKQAVPFYGLGKATGPLQGSQLAMGFV
jgi:hypothetical protein